MKNENYYLGLDIGTNSVGYAVTDKDYKLLKYKGEPMWGSHVFEEGSQCAERRSFRTARRRLDRRQQRVQLVQEIFAPEIVKIDEKFFVRLEESFLYREDANGNNPYIFFNDKGYTDKEYFCEYPTIHHLIVSLIESDKIHDIRLVYMAVAWLVAHRGHFLNDVDKENVEKVLDFNNVYKNLTTYYNTYDIEIPWKDNIDEFKNILLEKCGVKKKEELFKEALFEGKAYKNHTDSIIGTKEVFTLLSGGTVDAGKLFLKSEYDEKIQISFKKSEEEFEALLGTLDDDAEFLICLRAVYDWSLLYEASGGSAYISKAKIGVYEQHKKDLQNLKTFIKKYLPEKYDDVFRKPIDGNYVMYSYNFNSIKTNEKRPNRKTSKEDFCAYIKKLVKNVECEEEDKAFFNDMTERLDLCTFMPKQVDNDNRVIPYQLYYFELQKLLEKVSVYLPFLNGRDADGYAVKDKLLSIMEYRVPYYVGPLHSENSSHAWIERKAKGRIYPWNFNEKVDLDKSEAAFIDKMINKCTYLPGEKVLPKNSLLYCKFEVLNEINNIQINGKKIPVECKQGIYGLFKRYKKVTKNKIIDYLKSNNYLETEDEVTGLDITIKSSLKSYHDFRRLLENNKLTEAEVEDIIIHLTYTEDRGRIYKYLNENYAKLPYEDRKYISKLKYKDFGRLSKRFLNGLRGVVKADGTGEAVSIIQVLWSTNDNLMQIIFSDAYTFKEVIEEEKSAYYKEHPANVEQLLDDMYISNAVKRPIYRTLDIVKDVKKACGTAPSKIFVEMARGGGEKRKRSVSRRQQIKDFYKNLDSQEVRELSKLLDSKTDNELQREVLYLYFMQLGKCLYSGEPIDIEHLNVESYVNVDHIYPQAYVKDDSLNNKVLVMSKLNGEKGDKYPIHASIRSNMYSVWKHYKDKGLISEEKFYRLTRSTPFTAEEKMGFINRQLVETRQSTKAVTEIFKTIFPDTEIIYVKAGLASDFKHEYDVIKSREVNDLHHAKDAYLNIVCGNVYNSKFTKNFFLDNEKYSIKTTTVYGQPIHINGERIWNGKESIAMVKRIVSKNNIHYT
ncbi:MAG: type II CRISPR RNA-guided endonuclease Cas9, partial [Lachnospiraceae bacterium]|nr:type II CRISPR RNA-guided endonuclease Cas9 [Lachnospiraceae bacterium]